MSEIVMVSGGREGEWRWEWWEVVVARRVR